MKQPLCFTQPLFKAATLKPLLISFALALLLSVAG